MTFEQVCINIAIDNDSGAGEAVYRGKTYAFNYNGNRAGVSDDMPRVVFDAILRELFILIKGDVYLSCKDRIANHLERIERKVNIVVFCVVETAQPFICDVRGAFTIEALAEIEKQFAEEPPDYPKGALGITYECYWNPGQYGDEGRCEIEPYWGLIQVGVTFHNVIGDCDE